VTAKTHQLNDLCGYSTGHTLPDAQFEALYAMIEANVIRRIPALPVAYFSQEDLVPVPNPSWPHLSIVYQLLVRLLSLRPLAPQHMSFATALLPVCESPDPQERNAIIAFYQQLARSATAARPRLLFMVIAKIRDRLHGPQDSVFLLMTLLPVLQILLPQVSVSPSDQELIFTEVVLPSMTHPLFQLFANVVDPLLGFYIDDGTWASVALARFLIKKWPSSCPAKEVLFFERLMSSLAQLCVNDAEVLIPRLSRLVRDVNAVLHEKVAMAIASVWRQQHGMHLLANSPKLLAPLFAPLMQELSLKHWSGTVRQNAQASLLAFKRADPRGVQRALDTTQDLGFKAQFAGWTELLKVAHRADPSVVMKDAFGAITTLFPRRSSNRMEPRESRFVRQMPTSQRAQLIRPKMILRD
jgi:serine/threonine-protein phosphatase 2A regulatory subunit B'